MFKKICSLFALSICAFGLTPLSGQEEDIALLGKRTILDLYGPNTQIHYTCSIKNRRKGGINSESVMIVIEDEISNIYGVTIYDGYHRGDLGRVVILGENEKNYKISNNNGLSVSYNNQPFGIFKKDSAHLNINERTGKGEVIEKFSYGIFKSSYKHEYQLDKCQKFESQNNLIVTSR